MDRFKYHASAAGFSGNIRQPFTELIPIQASVALPPGGGFGTSRVERFQFQNIFSVESISAVVAGSFSERDHTFDSLSTTTLEGFNVLGVVTADRIVSRIAVSHPKDGKPPSITPIGSHFENLRIAGRKVEVDLATDTFHRLDTAPKVRDAYSANTHGFRTEFEGLSLMGKGEQIPPRLQPHFPWSNQQDNEKIPEHQIPEHQGEIHCGLVRGIGGLGSDLPCHGHTIHIHGFGVIRLAEMTITDFSRTITMIQIELGSTPSGGASGGSSSGNGTPTGSGSGY